MAHLAAGGGNVYATLLLNDTYLPGALVLAHSLRDASTTTPLAVLVTLDSVSADAVTQLKTVYDYVLPVPRIRNAHPSNLYLMNRPDLHSAFTKINLWKQTQFSKIVYIDADVLAYRAPEELFRIPHAFSAAPDIGWPDLFNTGVMVLTPNMGDYYAMVAMAERGISFDGADQGLLNMHFKNSYNRLSFTYNVTPSAHYQYLPAYRHFSSSINMVHFIGADKPWFAGRHAPHGSSPYDEMVGRWWAVYDRHYRVQESPSQRTNPASASYQHTSQPGFSQTRHFEPSTTQSGEQNHPHQDGLDQVSASAHSFSGHGQEPPHSSHDSQPASSGHPSYSVSSSDSFGAAPGTHAEARSEQVPEPQLGVRAPQVEDRQPEPPQITMHSWDAQRHPPPADSQPEAANFPSTIYAMSQDTTPFVPPERYPSPPKNMWYNVPEAPPAPTAQKPRAIFPWEDHRPRPSRSFQGQVYDPAETIEPVPAANSPAAPSPQGSNTAETKSEPSEPETPTPRTDASPWTSFPRINAWDNMPEIGRYVEKINPHRRTKSQQLAAAGTALEALDSPGITPSARPRGLRLTDFPTEVERPSLPVTPAAIGRPTFWGDDQPSTSDSGLASDSAGDGSRTAPLPAAQGVPSQPDWDPTAQLQKLAKEQSDALLRRLSAERAERGDEIPLRSLPFGSDVGHSPTQSRARAQTSEDLISPRPVHAADQVASGVLEGMGAAGEPVSLSEPSSAGPTVAFEKGEGEVSAS